MQSAESEAPFEPKIPSTPQSIRSSARVQANRTPSSRAVAQPVASTSKLSPPKLGTTTRQATPEIDIENDSGAESDSGGYHAGGSSEYSEEIVKQLERSLPRWPGFGEEGWMDDVSPVRFVLPLRTTTRNLFILGTCRSELLRSYMESRATRTSCKLLLPPALSSRFYSHLYFAEETDLRSRWRAYPKILQPLLISRTR